MSGLINLPVHFVVSIFFYAIIHERDINITLAISILRTMQYINNLPEIGILIRTGIDWYLRILKVSSSLAEVLAYLSIRRGYYQASSFCQSKLTKNDRRVVEQHAIRQLPHRPDSEVQSPLHGFRSLESGVGPPPTHLF